MCRYFEDWNFLVQTFRIYMNDVSISSFYVVWKYVRGTIQSVELISKTFFWWWLRTIDLDKHIGTQTQSVYKMFHIYNIHKRIIRTLTLLHSKSDARQITRGVAKQQFYSFHALFVLIIFSSNCLFLYFIRLHISSFCSYDK